ncbi:hypothetical protein K440DRAFT_665389 [Wilcoxina mikolae CBS 423.85]|nr:hypothetical protein K440DRAFT_665389 [Wilcoxina mikolae CBS 423.85]
MHLSVVTSFLLLGTIVTSSAVPAGRDWVITKWRTTTHWRPYTRTIWSPRYVPKPPKCYPTTITISSGEVCTQTITATTTSVTVATSTATTVTTETVHTTETVLTTETVQSTDTVFTTETVLSTDTVFTTETVHSTDTETVLTTDTITDTILVTSTTVSTDTITDHTTVTDTTTTTISTCTPTNPSLCTFTSPVGNPGFEDTAQNSAPWVETDSQGQGEGTNVPLGEHSGTRNFRLRIPGNAPPEFAYITIGQPLTLCKGILYNFSAWVRNPVLGSQCFAKFSIGGNVIATTDGSFHTEWTEVTASYTPSAGSELLEITVRCPGNPVVNGEQRDLFLDDVTLTLA